MKIDFANLNYQYNLYKEEIDTAIHKVLDKSNYILGEEVNELEASLSEFSNVEHSISCSSGTDALLLALMALDIKAGDEVITTPWTFIATAEAIALVGAKVVFADINEQTYNIDTSKIRGKITSKTKAILAVSLYGQSCDIDGIMNVAKEHNLKVIIDGAQSYGAEYKSEFYKSTKSDISCGDIGITSFFPAKPLGCFGDGGACFSNDDEIADKIKMLRVHGQNARYKHKYIGICGRMDTLQASILQVKLKHYQKDLALRCEVANKYNERLKSKEVVLPFVDSKSTSAWAQYCIRVKSREKLQKKLNDNNIPNAIHYPLPLHLQECFGYLGYKKGDFEISEAVSKDIIALPMNPYLSDEQIDYICSFID